MKSKDELLQLKTAFATKVITTPELNHNPLWSESFNTVYNLIRWIIYNNIHFHLWDFEGQGFNDHWKFCDFSANLACDSCKNCSSRKACRLPEAQAKIFISRVFNTSHPESYKQYQTILSVFKAVHGQGNTITLISTVGNPKVLEL